MGELDNVVYVVLDDGIRGRVSSVVVFYSGVGFDFADVGGVSVAVAGAHDLVGVMYESFMQVVSIGLWVFCVIPHAVDEKGAIGEDGQVWVVLMSL